MIRRREETNATRSLLNTARVMETNAVALRLKALETLEKVTEKIGTISVYGGLDSVLNDLVRMKQQFGNPPDRGLRAPVHFYDPGSKDRLPPCAGCGREPGPCRS